MTRRDLFALAAAGLLPRLRGTAQEHGPADAKARVGAAPVPLLAVLLGLRGRSHYRPGHPPDGRGAVVHQHFRPAFRGLLRANQQDHRLGDAGRVLRRVRVPAAHGDLDAGLLQLLPERLVHRVPGRCRHAAVGGSRFPPLQGALGTAGEPEAGDSGERLAARRTPRRKLSGMHPVAPRAQRADRGGRGGVALLAETGVAAGWFHR